MKTILALLLHPFAVTIWSLILGSLFFFENIKFADSTIPTWFYGSWSIYLAIAIWIGGASYLGYAIYTSYFKKSSTPNQ